MTECGPEGHALLKAVFQFPYGFESSVNGTAIEEWSDEPVSQQATAHRRCGAVQHRQDRRLILLRSLLAASQWPHEFEIANCGAIQMHGVTNPARVYAAEVCEGGSWLSLTKISQDRSSGSDSSGQASTVESVERVDCKLRPKHLFGLFGIEGGRGLSEEPWSAQASKTRSGIRKRILREHFPWF